MNTAELETYSAIMAAPEKAAWLTDLVDAACELRIQILDCQEILDELEWSAKFDEGIDPRFYSRLVTKVFRHRGEPIDDARFQELIEEVIEDMEMVRKY